MTCTYSRSRRPARYVPHYGNLVNEFFNTAVGDIVQKADKKHFTNPATNVLEHDDRFELELALPGFGKKDITIEVDNDILKIESAIESKGDSTYRLREFNYGGFKKHFKLPKSVDRDSISASFAKGILTVTLAKRDEAIPQPAKSIKIK